MPANLNLRPKVKRMMIAFLAECKKQGCEVFVTQGVRTLKEQEEIYAQGRTKAGKVVSWARPGYSPHNWGVAFDIAFRGKELYPILSNPVWEKVGKIGEKIGLSWGGRWTKTPDRPHFEFFGGYRMDYKVNDFLSKKVDSKKFL